MPIHFRNILVLLTIFFAGCALKLPEAPREDLDALYVVQNDSNDILTRNAPIFLVRDHPKSFNRIGAPSAKVIPPDDHEIYIDTENPLYYTLIQEFEIKGKPYTNLIYRIHFPETPLPRLTSGKNVGLLVYITLDAKNNILLVTTLHTCGCYLSFIPSSNLMKSVLPDNWPQTNQTVYGKKLPARFDPPKNGQHLVIDLDSETHRVRNIMYGTSLDFLNTKKIEAGLLPMGSLDRLSLAEKSVSFFETEGFRKGYVKNSRKRLEMLLMSWWAMDLFVGEDKALGPPEKTGVDFYTSLKFWARRRSNIWFFPEFLDYWGWHFDRLSVPDH